MDPKKRSQFQINAKIEMLADRLRKVQPGEVISYEAITEVSGKSLQQGGRYMIQAARDRIEKTDGILFSAVTRVGIRRLTENEVATDASEAYVRKVHRSARRGSKRLDAGVKNFGTLSSTEKMEWLKNRTILGFAEQATGKKISKKIENAVVSTQKQLPADAVMALISNLNKD